jgi:hypothetical protein
MKISIFRFYMTIETKTNIYIHKNKVYSMFPSNFIREIKKTGILWYCDILWYIHLYVNIRNSLE